MPRQNRGIERLKTEVNRSSPDAYENRVMLRARMCNKMPNSLFVFLMDEY